MAAPRCRCGAEPGDDGRRAEEGAIGRQRRQMLGPLDTDHRGLLDHAPRQVPADPAERGDLTGRDIATALAGRFAVKEAFAKALDGARGVGWHEVQVRRSSSGKPTLELSGNAVAMVIERV